MKQFFGIFSAMLALVMLLGGCTSGGNVSERNDGMIGQTHESRDEHGESSGDLFDEEQEDDNAAKSRRIVRRR